MLALHSQQRQGRKQIKGCYREEAGESLGQRLESDRKGQREARAIARFGLFLFRTAIPRSPASL